MPSRLVKVAVVQFSCSADIADNIKAAKNSIQLAAAQGAQVIVLQELFASLYFPIEQADNFSLAVPARGKNTYIEIFRELAGRLNVVLPISFFEQAGNVFFNSVAVIDADGSTLGTYRKSHIPDSPGYHEKWHFSPGDTGFRVFQTRYCALGVGICWDQWFPEAARAMVLGGAELLVYPTAIGSEPQDPSLDSSGHWQRCMGGHAAANVVPVVAANRWGTENARLCDTEVTFYGSSFIMDHTGDIVAQAPRAENRILTHTFDLEMIRCYRRSWGLFRDRRPELYDSLSTLSGTRT